MSINLTLIGQMITFTLLVWFTMRYVWPPLLEAMEARKQKIAEGLVAAEKAEEDVVLAEKKVKQQLRVAKTESAAIIALAQKRGDELIEKSKATAKLEGAKIMTAAEAQIAQDVQQAKEGLRKEVSSLALQAAEQILQAEINQAKHQKLISKVCKQLE